MEYKLQKLASPMTVSRIANIHSFEFTKTYQTTEDAHNFCELLYVDKGSLYICSDDYTGILKSNQLLIHRPNQMHSFQCEDGVHSHVIIIGFECTAPELTPFSSMPVTLRTTHRRMLAGVMQEGANLFAPPYDIPNTQKMKRRSHSIFGTEQMLKLNLESFLITLVRDKAPLRSSISKMSFPKNKLESIKKYIEEHYTEKILLDNICFLFGMNKTSLCRDFRDKYNITILGYIDRLKVENAKTAPQDVSLSVTEVSERMGFGSIHYFSRYFKRHTGMSPGQYRVSLAQSAAESEKAVVRP